MFQLAAEETSSLRSQIATLKTRRGQHRKYLPHAFTEHGAIMAATILNSPRAIEMSVYVVRAFVQLREMLAAHAPACPEAPAYWLHRGSSREGVAAPQSCVTTAAECLSCP